IWDVEQPGRPAQLVTLSIDVPVRAIAFRPDGDTLLTTGDDGTTILWNLSDPSHPSRIVAINRHSDVARTVAISPDARTLATGNSDGTTTLWDLTGPRSIRRSRAISRQ